MQTQKEKLENTIRTVQHKADHTMFCGAKINFTKHFWVFLAAPLSLSQRPVTVPDAALSEPEICYVLDGILFLYGVILTALYCRIKIYNAREASDGKGKSKQVRATARLKREPPCEPCIVEEGIYTGLTPHKQDTYETIGMKKPLWPLRLGLCLFNLKGSLVPPEGGGPSSFGLSLAVMIRALCHWDEVQTGFLGHAYSPACPLSRASKDEKITVVMPSLNQKSEFFGQREGGRRERQSANRCIRSGKRQHLLSPHNQPDGLTSLLDRIPTTLYPQDHGSLDRTRIFPESTVLEDDHSPGGMTAAH
ncbi:hypothetical protein CCH79_00014519 [Gambusia affinis]|uniref:Uncharacterized protein n=1 Tax=Gambusia affinis TaxID=33528 RepID=A0A315UUD1_GAMAF|nr:hypothetical protein CCH79_00014519 [Gambusia affinis]